MCDSIWSHYHYLEWSLRMRRVTWPITGGAKMIHIFEIPDPNFPIHFVTFRELRRRLSHACYRRKIAFSHCVGYKVYCTCAVSRGLCIWGPPKPHVTIFWPRIVYSLYSFYGTTMTINGSFILEHPHVKAILGSQKKLSPVKIGPQNGGFSKI